MIEDNVNEVLAGRVPRWGSAWRGASVRLGAVLGVLLLAGACTPAPGNSGSTQHAKGLKIAPTTQATDSVAGRALTKAQARRASRAAGRVLPGWSRVPNDPDTSTTFQQSRCQKLITADDAADKRRPRSAEVKATFQAAQKRLPRGTKIGIFVTSYSNQRTAAEEFGSLRTVLTRCPKLTVADSTTVGGRQHWSIREDQPPTLGYPTLGFEVRVKWAQRSAPGIPGTVVVRHRLVVIGHNVVTGDVRYSQLMTEPSAKTLSLLDQLLHFAMAATIRDLQKS